MAEMDDREISDETLAQLKSMLSGLEVVGDSQLNSGGVVSIMLDMFIRRLERTEKELLAFQTTEAQDAAVAAYAALESKHAEVRLALEASKWEGHRLVDDGETMVRCGSTSLNWFCHKQGLPDGSCLCGFEGHNERIDQLLAGDAGKGWVSPAKHQAMLKEVREHILFAVDTLDPVGRWDLMQRGHNDGFGEVLTNAHSRLVRVLPLLMTNPDQGSKGD